MFLLKNSIISLSLQNKNTIEYVTCLIDQYADPEHDYRQAMGTMNYTQKSLALGRSSLFKGVSGVMGNYYLKNIAVYSTQLKLSNNPWIRFLQMNKGKYSGKGWLNNARQDYYQLKSARGL